MLFPFMAVGTAYAGANDLTVSDHEGQLDPAGTYTNGQVKTYSEGDPINFHFTVTAADAASGQMQVEFTEDDGFCTFFDGSFALGTHDSSSPAVVTSSGATPTVTLSGTPTVVSGDWVQLVDVSFAAAGEAVVSYYLTLSNDASNCNGSSQNSQLSNSANTGDFANIGAQTVPVPAKDVLGAVTPIVDLVLTSQCSLPNGARWFVLNENDVAVDFDWMFAGAGATGSETAPAAGDADTLPWAPGRGANYTFFDTPQTGTLIIKWLDENGDMQQTTKATNPEPCAPPPPATATVIAHKVVCDFESQLPNAGNGSLRTIDADTAQDWVDQTDGCELAEDWSFEYKTADNRSNPGDETVGSAGGDWVTFTATGTEATTEVEVDNVGLLQLREILPSEDYIPFGGNNNYSAEFYCANDAKNYDNWEWIRNPQEDATYHCVGFNALKPAVLSATKIECTSEDYLPNWGDGTSGPSQITATTADEWLAEGTNSEVCEKVDWEFQWAPNGTNNPGDQVGDAGGPWETFSTTAEVPVSDRVWVREVFQDDYVEFAGKTKNDAPNGSAEIYCHTDVVNYDNYDFVRPVEAGEEYHCVAWNALQDAEVVIEKRVVNNNGGTAKPGDFELFSSDGFNRTARDHNVPFNVLSGETVIVGEAPYDGYAEELVTCGDVTDVDNPIRFNARQFVAEAGHSYRCVIINNDIAPVLTVNKEVKNNWNGGLGADDFTLLVNDQEVVNGVQVELSAGTYTVGELEVMGYSLEGITGDCAIDGSITLEIGGTYTCNLLNVDEPARIKVIKKVVNDDGGTAVASDFALFVNRAQVRNNVFGSFPGNTETVISERTQVRGYEMTDISCFDISGPNGRVNVGHPFEAENGREYVCQITNDDVAPTLQLKKTVINDNGGNNLAGDWTLTAEGENATYIDNPGRKGGPTMAITQQVDVRAGEAIKLSESGPRGYDASDWECTAGRVVGGDTVYLRPGQNAVCEIVNDDRPVNIRVVKIARNDDGGRMLATDFQMYINGRDLSNNLTDSGNRNPVDSYAEYSVRGVNSNRQYTVSEDDKRGYELEGIRCFLQTRNGERPLPHPFTPDEGMNVECRVFNNDKPAELTLVKVVRNNDGGGQDQDNWTLRADGPTTVQGRDRTNNPNTGVTREVSAGWYYLSESGRNPFAENGYELRSIRCNGERLDLSEPRIRLRNGQEVTCVFVNDDIPPTLRLRKAAVSVDQPVTQEFELGARQAKNTFESPYTVDVDPNTTTPRGVRIDGSDGLDAGWVRIYENVPENWRLARIVCFPTEFQIRDDVVRSQSEADEFTAENVEQRRDGTWVRLRPGQDVTCRFVNLEEAKVTVTKFWDVNQNGQFDENESTLPEWTFELERCRRVMNSGLSLEDQVERVLPIDPRCFEQGQTDLVTSNDHQFNRLQEGTTGEDGSVMFPGLAPFGHYVLSEQFQEGWNISGIYCDYGNEQSEGRLFSPNRYHIYMVPGAEVECYVGNYQDGQLQIAKTNNRIGDNLVDGDTVVYQITVTNPENSGISYETVTYDLMPANIVYVSGSGSASSSVRGALTSPLDGLDYVADGPATWEIGDLVPGEVVTLTYSAIIANDTEPGTYENIAFVEGWSCQYQSFIFDDRDVLGVTTQATATLNTLDDIAVPVIDDDHEDEHEHKNPCPFGGEYYYPSPLAEVQTNQVVGGFANLVSVIGNIVNGVGDPFVESAVTVVEETEPQGFVLGISTQQLANTGAAAIMPPVVGALVAATALYIATARERRSSGFLRKLAGSAKHLVLVLGMLVGLSGSAVAATGAGWQLNVVDLPEATSSNSIDIAYQVASIDGGDTFTVELWQDGAMIDSAPVTTAYGDNGFFTVADLEDGSYEFTVLANNSDDPTDKTNTQTVAVDTASPEAAEYDGVVQNGNEYTLTFTVPEGSDGTTVNVYASTEKEFTADETTLVGSVAATPGAEQTFTYTAADGLQRYFALEVVDVAGNTSTLVGDSEAVVTPSTTATSGSSSTGEETEVLGEDEVAQIGEPTVSGELPEDSEDEGSSASRGWIALGVLAVIVAGYVFRQRTANAE